MKAGGRKDLVRKADIVSKEDGCRILPCRRPPRHGLPAEGLHADDSQAVISIWTDLPCSRVAPQRVELLHHLIAEEIRMQCWLFFHREVRRDVPEAAEVMRFQQAAAAAGIRLDVLQPRNFELIVDSADGWSAIY